MSRFFSKFSGAPACAGDVDSPAGVVGNKAPDSQRVTFNQGRTVTHGRPVRPDFSGLRPEAPASACEAAPSEPVHATRGGVAVVRHGDDTATSLRYTSAAASGGAGLSFQMSRTPRLPRGVTFAFCVPCGRRGAAHRDGVCTNSERHP